METFIKYLNYLGYILTFYAAGKSLSLIFLRKYNQKPVITIIDGGKNDDHYKQVEAANFRKSRKYKILSFIKKIFTFI